MTLQGSGADRVTSQILLNKGDLTISLATHVDAISDSEFAWPPPSPPLLRRRACRVATYRAKLCHNDADVIA